MKHGSLFSGIGGFDLAAEWMGWENVFHCEWNPFGQRVLKHHFPNAISYEDITTTDFSIHRGSIDVLSGGFPCQPYSQPGKRKGKEDERHLWPEMLRAIRQIQPTWVVGENVRGLVNWNGGMVFDEIQTDLEAEGYEVIPFLLPACGVNAPHRRERIWFIAYSDSFRLNRTKKSKIINDQRIREGLEKGHGTAGLHDNGATSNPNSERLQRCGNERIDPQERKESFNEQFMRLSQQIWEEFPTKPPIRGGNDGLPRELDSITVPKWIKETVQGYGNAVVPVLVEQIFKTIQLTAENT